MTEIRERWTRVPAASTRRRRWVGAVLPVVATLCSLAIGAVTLFAQAQATYLYSLSSLSGRLPYNGVRVRMDQERDEAYVIYQNVVRVFGSSGMEVFSFGDGLDVGQILDAAVDRDGDVFLLSYKDSRSIVTRCNFRGLPVGGVEIRNLPDGLVLDAGQVIYRNGLLYFFSQATSSVIITDGNGEFRKHIEFRALLEPDDRQKGEAGVIGFTVDQEGSVFFTMPALFKVYKVSPDGSVRSFGRSGSTPGRFGIVAGVVSDSHGNLFVADRLKCVVMVFDRDFRFLTEFGYRGTRPENLIQPDEVAIDRKDRLYVSQWRNRGVSVFTLTLK
jgi:hypothetical protein